MGGAPGFVLGHSGLEGYPPVPGLEREMRPGVRQRSARYLTQDFDMVDGQRVIGTLSITFRGGDSPPSEIVEWCGVVADLMGVAVARYRMESLLLNTQRFELAGQIAAGLVHDFNNLLTGIMGHSAVARARMTPDHPAASALRVIDEVAVTGGTIAHMLLDFVRGVDDGSGGMDPNAVVRYTQQLMTRAIRDAVAVQIDLAADVPVIAGTPMLLQQAIVNLVVNAADAIEGSGEVTIRTRLVAELPAGLRTLPEPASRYVTIAVADTRCGIPAALLGRVIQPFFTTKGGLGTGLGLTSVVRVAQRHGGAVHVASAVG